MSRAAVLALASTVCVLQVASAQPRVVWSARYDGPAHREDRPTTMVRDAAGNTYVAGYSFGDSSDFDFATVKFGPQGDTIWTRRYGSPLNSEDRPWCLALDSSGCVVASGGTIADRSRGWDFQTVKYSPGGDTAWLRRTDFIYHHDDKPAALAVLPDNSLVVAGASRRKASGPEPRADWDISLVRYTAAGDTLWTRLWGGPAHLDDYASALAVDAGGNIYLLGKSVVSPPSPDIALLKYRPDGSLAWQRTIDGAGHATDMASSVLLDRAGCLYVVGSATGPGTSFDYLVARFDAAGSRLWQQTYDGAGRVDVAQAACLDPRGGVVVTGQSTGAGSSFDIATIKYSPAGQRLWARRHNGAASSADRGWCLAADGEGNVVVGANSVGAASFPDLLVLAYSPAGDTLWSWRGPAAVSGEARPVAVVWDSAGVLVAGHDHNPETGFDFRLMLLETAGPDR